MVTRTGRGALVARIDLALVRAATRNRRWSVPASAAIHVGVVALAILVSLRVSPPLPEPRTVGTAIAAFPVMAAPRTAPAEVPPRPAGPARSPRTAPAVVLPVTSDRPLDEPAPIDEAGETRPCSGCLPGLDDGTGAGSGPGDVGLAGPGAPGSEAGTPIRVGRGVEAPRKLIHVVPRYPELAQRASVQGTVEIECVIDPAGQVAELTVKRGHPLLQAAAVEAVRQWRYTPTRLNGAPVAVVMTVTVQFSLRREGR